MTRSLVWAPARPVGIRGLGAYLPTERLTNPDLQARGCPVSESWILEKTGIAGRHVAADGEAMSDLAIAAVRRAMCAARVGAEALDAVIVVGDNHDYGGVRTTSGVVAEALGIDAPACVDIRSGCPGSVIGLHVAAGLVSGGLARRVALCAAEISTRGIDWTARSSVWFGDGAASAIIEECQPGTGILGSFICGQGLGAEILQVPAGGSREPTTQASLSAGRHQLWMDARAVFPWAVEKFVETVHQLTTQHSVDLGQVRAIVPHQANLRIIEAAMARLDLPMSRAVVNLDRVGNTGCPATLLALHDAVQAQRVGPGDLVVTVGFGGGLAWGGQLIRLNQCDDFTVAGRVE